MSLDYEFAPIDVSIMTHPKACAAGPEAMGLWLWGQTYAKVHKTGGRLHRPAVLAAWGGRRNIMLAKRLEEAGLWLLREDGDWDVHNFDRKTGARSSSAERMRRLRAKKPTSDAPGDAPSDVTCDGGDVTVTRTCDAPCSTSVSISPSGSDLVTRSDLPGRSGGPPDWWAGAVSAAEGAVGSVSDPGARWLEYDASRERKGWARGHRDAVGWLTAVVRRERQQARGSPKGAEATRQPFDPDAPWMKLEETGA